MTDLKTREENEKEKRSFLEAARMYANLDGCEPGDLIRSLCHCAEMAHYSYVDENVAEETLLALIEVECAKVHYYATCPERADYGYDDAEYTDEVLAEIEAIRKG